MEIPLPAASAASAVAGAAKVAMRSRKKIYWDAKAMKVTNAPGAEKFLKETYREGWEVG